MLVPQEQGGCPGTRLGPDHPRILAEAADALHPHPADGWSESDGWPELTKGHTGSSGGESGLISHPF